MLVITNDKQKGDENMSVVIIGGNERMERQYQQICKTYGYKAKVLQRKQARLKEKSDSPTYLLFLQIQFHIA